MRVTHAHAGHLPILTGGLIVWDGLVGRGGEASKEGGWGEGRNRREGGGRARAERCLCCGLPMILCGRENSNCGGRTCGGGGGSCVCTLSLMADSFRRGNNAVTTNACTNKICEDAFKFSNFRGQWRGGGRGCVSQGTLSVQNVKIKKCVAPPLQHASKTNGKQC